MMGNGLGGNSFMMTPGMSPTNRTMFPQQNMTMMGNNTLAY